VAHTLLDSTLRDQRGRGAAADEHVRYGTARGRWVIPGGVLGSGIAFLDSTVVNVALPEIGDDLGGFGLQWTLDGYVLTLSSLLLLGGALGDHRSAGTRAPIGTYALVVLDTQIAG
jgi:MFS family permease